MLGLLYVLYWYLSRSSSLLSLGSLFSLHFHVNFQFHPCCNVRFVVLASFISFFITSSIFVVALLAISFKFMQGKKYMHFANIGLFIPFILLSFIGDC